MNRGLIEARSIQVWRPAEIALPRFMNRGLIEAVGADPSGDVLDTVLPRFMNRGLIEAFSMAA